MHYISEAASSRIKSGSLLCAMLVVSIHVTWPHAERFSAGWFMHEFISEGVARMAVPWFFIVSGYFLACHFNESKWWYNGIKKRIHTLFIPYILWNIITLASVLSLNILANLLAHRSLLDSVHVPDNLLGAMGFDFIEYPANITLWYLRSLMILVLISPILKTLVLNLKWVWLVIASLGAVLFEYIPNDNYREFFRIGLSACGVLYFSLGMCIRCYGLRMVSARTSIFAGVIGVSALIAKVCIMKYSSETSRFLTMLSVPFLLLFFYRYGFNPRLSILGGCSFPIFAIHEIVLVNIGVFLAYISISEFTHAVFMFASSVVISICVAFILRTWFPKTSHLLFGWR